MKNNNSLPTGNPNSNPRSDLPDQAPAPIPDQSPAPTPDHPGHDLLSHIRLRRYRTPLKLIYCCGLTVASSTEVYFMKNFHCRTARKRFMELPV
jgi:hypothetical protein